MAYISCLSLEHIERHIYRKAEEELNQDRSWVEYQSDQITFPGISDVSERNAKVTGENVKLAEAKHKIEALRNKQTSANLKLEIRECGVQFNQFHESYCNIDKLLANWIDMSQHKKTVQTPNFTLKTEEDIAEDLCGVGSVRKVFTYIHYAFIVRFLCLVSN